MPNPGVATAADYSEALTVVRRVKSLLALFLLLMLLGQIAIFFLVRYDIVRLNPVTNAPDSVSVPHMKSDNDVAMTPTTLPAAADRLGDVMHYVTGVVILAGIAISIVMAMVLMLIDHIMLVGRLIGVGKVTSALCWAFLLVVLLFPWQYFMSNAALTFTDFRVPGVLWTWDEMASRAHFTSSFDSAGWADTTLSWFRFVGAPLVAIVITLLIQARSNRGLKMAMGEDELLNEMMRQQ